MIYLSRNRNSGLWHITPACRLPNAPVALCGRCERVRVMFCVMMTMPHGVGGLPCTLLRRMYYPHNIIKGIANCSPISLPIHTHLTVIRFNSHRKPWNMLSSSFVLIIWWCSWVVLLRNGQGTIATHARAVRPPTLYVYGYLHRRGKWVVNHKNNCAEYTYKHTH